ncbi:right-handed parallel beta-helix repeat-containing protein [Haliangium ochraceum]|nr:right-handed parallel beta-helix repeat-containing protein [Haliangium ochraceum]
MYLAIPVVALVLAQAGELRAQSCDCDHTVDLDTTIVDAAALGIAPGERVCVTAGERPFLRFRNLSGSEEAPITIINCGGLVRIHNEDRAYALVFENDSKYFHLTGTGDPALTYGFELSAPDQEPYGAVGLSLIGRSSNYEVDHIEIHDTGFAGVSAKTDPLCDGSADQENFVQRDVWLHHLYVHDTRGEGFYIGSTQANGQNITCDGQQELHQPHFLEGIALTDSIIENTGWDGAQVGMARSGCVVARNLIRNVGLEGVEYQQQGLQIGSFSRCEIAQNALFNGPTNGIFVLEADDTWVHDNLVVNFEADGIYANVRERFEGKRYRIHFNTVVDAGRNAVSVFGGLLGPSEARSNLTIGSGTGISAGGDVPWTEEANLHFATAAEAGLVGDGDYHLRADSPARGAGVGIAALLTDLDGFPRATPPAVGAYEYRDPNIDAGPVPGDGGVVQPPGGGGADAGPGGEQPGDGDGGGCRATPGDAPGAGSGALWLLALAAGLLWRRRRTPAAA